MADERMSDSPLAGLWIRRQLFEHSVAVPLLTSASASQIDFTRLAKELSACSVYMDNSAPPAVSYSDWVAMAGLHARLDSSDDAGVIIEALETNAPEAFVRCNDREKLAPGKQLNYKQLNIPVPELVAFLRLHAAATMASRFRETCQANWPEDTSSSAQPNANTNNNPLSSPSPPSPASSNANASNTPNSTANNNTSNPNANPLGSPQSSNVGARPSLSALPISLVSPNSPRLASRPTTNTNSAAPSSPMLGANPNPTAKVPPGSPVPGATPSSISSPGVIDGLSARKKTPNRMVAQSAILASVQNSLLRETELVSRNITHLLEVVAACYGLFPGDRKKNSLPDEPTSTGLMGSRTPESGKLVRVNSDRRRGDTSDAKRAAVRNLPVTKDMFQHLSFLLTTNVSPEGARRPIASVVPQWQDGNDTVRLGELVDIVRTALAREPTENEDPIDVSEFMNLDKKTILRETFPDCNTPGNRYPHGREVRISNCTSSHLYLLAALGRVSFIACRDCTLFIGACVSVSIINCVNVRVHAVARVCRVTNCFDTEMYLCTNRFPQIVGDNRGLVFAPYNAVYDNVARDMAELGVSPTPNVWDNFYRPAYRGNSGRDNNSSSGDPDLTSAVATVLPPEKFFPFAIPIPSPAKRAAATRSQHNNNNIAENNTCAPNNATQNNNNNRGLFSIPLPLPPQYATGLAARKHEIDIVRRDIRALDAELLLAASNTKKKDESVSMNTTTTTTTTFSESDSDDGRNNTTTSTNGGVLTAIVQAKFRDWLVSSGNMRQISELLRMDHEYVTNGDTTSNMNTRPISIAKTSPTPASERNGCER